MKQLLLVLLLGLASIPSMAQGVGIEAGGSLNNMQAFYNGNPSTTGFRPAVRAGVIAQERLLDNLSFQYGVFYTAKGGKLSYSTIASSEVNGYLRADYIEIPLSAVYHLRLKENNSLFFGAGPYAGIAFGGIVALDEEVPSGQGGFSVLLPASIGNDADYDDFRLFDMGVSAFAGYEHHSGFFGKIGGSYGLTDIHPSPYFNMYNYNFWATVGYMIR